MNKIFPTLYSQDTTGNTRIWYMEQDGNRYRTHSGVLGSPNIVITEWTVTAPKNVGKKNATTAIEQATAEIEAKYKKQLKTGYHEDINNASQGTSYIEPMLAQPLKKLTTPPNYASGNWGVQCKFNGNRCIASKNGLFSRKGERYMSVPHIENELKAFFDKHPDAVLDGELFNNDLRQQLNKINTLIRKTTDIDVSTLKESEQKVRFYVYDGYNFNTGYSRLLTENASYRDRKQWIDNNVVGQYKYIEHVKTTIANSEEEMLGIFHEYLDDKQEGVILRNMNGGYEHKRSKNLVKVKLTEDSEARIIGIIEGIGNFSGLAAKASMVWDGPDGSTEFNANFMGSEPRRQEILKNPNDWIGKSVTFLYEGLTGKFPRKPNYARIDPDNCFKIDR